MHNQSTTNVTRILNAHLTFQIIVMHVNGACVYETE
jgi:hypothetical protein